MALRKYGEDSFHWEEIDYAYSIEELYEKEIYWIDFYKTYGTGKGYNLTKGGEGASGLERDEDFRKDKSELMKSMWSSGKINIAISSVINEEIAVEIKDLILEGKSDQEITDSLGVSKGIVRSIKYGTAWRSVITDADMEAITLIREGMNEERAQQARDMILEGKSLKEIGEYFNVHHSTISAIKMGRVWRNVISDEDVKKMSLAMPITNRSPLTKADVLEIKELLLGKEMKNKDIAVVYNVNRSYISRIKRGLSWRHLFTDEELEIINSKKHKPKVIKPKKEKAKPTKAKVKKEKVKKTKVKKPKIEKPKIEKPKKIKVNKQKQQKPKSPKKEGVINQNFEDAITKTTHDLTESEIREIKKLLHEDKHTQRRIAEMYGVYPMIIYRIKNGDLFKDVI